MGRVESSLTQSRMRPSARTETEAVKARKHCLFSHDQLETRWQDSLSAVYDKAISSKRQASTLQVTHAFSARKAANQKREGPLDYRKEPNVRQPRAIEGYVKAAGGQQGGEACEILASAFFATTSEQRRDLDANPKIIEENMKFQDGNKMDESPSSQDLGIDHGLFDIVTGIFARLWF